MKRPNIILLIIDTLREDHGKGLEALEQFGFVKYENAIAPAPWTLPSHASIFTGLYPSMHGIHESYGVYVGEKMAELSSAKMEGLRLGLLGELGDYGYDTYIITANPFITPLHGFRGTKSIHLRGFLYSLDNAYLNDLLRLYKNHLRLARELMRRGQAWLSIKGAYYFARSKIDQALVRAGIYERPILEKGSNLILEILDDALRGGRRTGIDLRKDEGSFFLFINMMEAHAPYVAGDIDDSLSVNAYLEAVFKGEAPREAVNIWRKRYPIHSAYAVSRALDIVRKLSLVIDDSLFIVTSDHGELLGDGGFSHGYFLEDGVLRVPLYIRWPRGMTALKQEGQLISLTQVPSLIRGVVDGSTPVIGRRIAMAESFGSNFNYSGRISVTEEEVKRVFSHRVKVYLQGGKWFVYNEGTDSIEKVEGMGMDEAKATAKNLLQW